MATSTQQGTGKHAHKSAAEPEPHHEAPTTTGSKSSGSHKAETHKAEPHKPESHSKETRKEAAQKATSAKGSDDLESRAYTGPDGKEHHHTKAYMEQHKGDK